jgi:peptidoglycan/xylan/chitin deacetylase (PgdA/CDA1 family)
VSLFPSKLRRVAGRVRDRLGPRAAILLYHRVGNTPTDPYLLRVRTRHFEEQMEVLARRGLVIPLRALAAHRRLGSLPHGAVAITFDDGYVDNLRVAKPILEKHGLPATVFMTAGSVGREREFWWDELERIVLGTPELPASLDGEQIFDNACLCAWRGHHALESFDEEEAVEAPVPRWNLNGAARVNKRDAHAWNLTQPSDPSPRHKLLRDVHAVIRVIPHEPRQTVLDRLRAWARADETVRPEFRAMSPDEMRELANGGLIDVGAHTMTHPSLPTLSAKMRRREIVECRNRLQEILGAPVNSFAYPYGDVDDATATAVADAGFQTACACEGRVVVPRSRPLRLPRLDVLDWDGETFEKHLEHWLRG